MITSYTPLILSVFLYTTYPIHHSEAARITCKYGEQILCGSDGFTYNNMCDLRIVQTVRPNLTVKHMGSCKARNGRLLDTLLKIIELQKNMVKDNALRSKKHWIPKTPYCKEVKVKLNKRQKSDLTRMLLSQMTNIQENIGAFEFSNNTINTQGTD
ncbi:uncharacterized protein LOC123690962 [Colias croceus]|uniref:uncharacterized protein LOC123690962 n=1 Tax=Colias crocea TaxID=72248 RepID=UPI001E280ABE|nr:uncharacterized protein LOC123690962 [Colias croceus]